MSCAARARNAEQEPGATLRDLSGVDTLVGDDPADNLAHRPRLGDGTRWSNRMIDAAARTVVERSEAIEGAGAFGCGIGDRLEDAGRGAVTKAVAIVGFELQHMSDDFTDR